MEGHVEVHLPQEQYEFIGITYKFTDEREREVAIESAITDIMTYRGIIAKRLPDFEDKKLSSNLAIDNVTDTYSENGVDFRLYKGIWQFYSESRKKWLNCETHPKTGDKIK